MPASTSVDSVEVGVSRAASVSRVSSSSSNSGAQTPIDTNSTTSARSQTPTNQPITTNTSAHGSPSSPVEGKPSPPPGLSPVQANLKHAFTYNGRQVQFNPAPAHQAHQQMQQQQLMQQQQMQYQLQFAQFQQQLAQQALNPNSPTAVPNAARATRDRRQPHPHPNSTRHYANQQPGVNAAQPQAVAGQNGPASPTAAGAFYPQQLSNLYAAGGMTYEMYQQMLFSSGQLDASVFAALLANGQMYNMYQLAMANNLNAFYPNGLTEQQAYAIQMQQQAAYYAAAGAADANGVNTTTGRHAKNASNGALLANPAAGFSDYNAAAAAAVYAQQFGYGLPAGAVSAAPFVPASQLSPRDAQLLQEQHSTNRQFSGNHRDGRHSHRAMHNAHINEEGVVVEGVYASEIPPHAGLLPTEVRKSTAQPSTYKTEICRSHQATGSCEYGSSCQFSHGAHELRSREVDSKYKSELCKNFHGANGMVGSGSCWYGNRCRFLHDEFRIQHAPNEFWLVAPADHLIRVERIQDDTTAGAQARLEQLAELMASDHNKKQTLLYAASVGCIDEAAPEQLNQDAFKTHMQTQMQAQLASQGEAQIHVREERVIPNQTVGGAATAYEPRNNKYERRNASSEEGQFAQVPSPHAHQASEMHEALLNHPGTAAARMASHNEGVNAAQPSKTGAAAARTVVAITPILPLNAATAAAGSPVTPAAMTPTAAASGAAAAATSPVAAAGAPAVMSYAKRVAIAPIVAPAAAPAPVKPAVTVASVKPTSPISPVAAAAAAAAAPASRVSPTAAHATQTEQWHTATHGKHGKRHGRRSHSPNKSSSKDEEHKEQELVDDEAEVMSHIIAKLAEVEMKEKEASEQAERLKQRQEQEKKSKVAAERMD